MTDDQSRTERKTAPTRRRRARTSDGDAEVNPPGEPSSRGVAPGRERRSNEMPGRKSLMKSAPWAPRKKEHTTPVDDKEDGFEDEDEDDSSRLDAPHDSKAEPGRLRPRST